MSHQSTSVYKIDAIITWPSSSDQGQSEVTMNTELQNSEPSNPPRQPRNDCKWCGVCNKYRTRQYWTSSEALSRYDECSYEQRSKKQSSQGRLTKDLVQSQQAKSGRQFLHLRGVIARQQVTLLRRNHPGKETSKNQGGRRKIAIILGRRLRWNCWWSKETLLCASAVRSHNFVRNLCCIGKRRLALSTSIFQNH